MSAMPLFGGKLKCRIEFELIGSPGPGAKEIAGPTFGIDQHVRRSLTVGVAIKPCVAQSNPKQCTRVETMNVRDPRRDAFLVVIRGRGLRHERRDIRELRAHRKHIDVCVEHVLRRQDRLNPGEGIEPLRFDLVLRPTWPTYPTPPTSLTNP